MSRNKVAISDFLTVEEVVTAIKLYRIARAGTFAEKCAEEIIEPVLPRINEKLGHENHPLYLAYLVEYVFMETGVKQRITEIEQQERIWVNPNNTYGPNGNN
jgi:hypothetical protein